MALAVHIEALEVWRESAASEPRRVLEGFSLEIAPRERVALVGPNGAGKTSLLLALVGAAPFKGRITLGERRLERATLAELRREVGFVFAEPGDQLFLPTVGEEVAFGPRVRGVPEAELDERVRAALTRVGLEGFEARAPGELSLGEQRRLAFATVLSYAPGLVLADEPTASLDPLARRELLRTLARIDATLVFATHDLEGARAVGARIVLMRGGRLIATGPADELMADRALLVRAGLEAP
ncbi:MAG: ABC transporter ATP-binding protein [Sorangiineae bacterium]|nr:ABC transporter ATP-binding protein [Polyangiaceae bacterium]MEB2323449.1 ABC transporter ATP-binding protein [Sorangiineae bacterium]